MSGQKSIFITGAASGIGRETAHFFAGKGWLVGACDVSEEGLESLAGELGDSCFTVAGDVTDPASIAGAVEAFTSRSGGRLNVLFNNAGILSFGRFEEVDLERNLATVDVNFKGLLTTTRAALPAMKNTPGARIVNMSSASAMYGIPELSVYSATKHAVSALTEAWNIEMKGLGISVCDLLAPYVNTPLLKTEKSVYSVEKLGINLSPADVARTVWKAAHGSGLHYMVGAPAHALAALFWALPFARARLTRLLTMNPKEK